MERAPFVLSKLHLIKEVSGLQLAPDERSVVFTITSADNDENRRKSVIAFLSLQDENGSIRILSEGDSPVWSPDGNKIAFLNNEDGKNGIWIYDLVKNNKNFLVSVFESHYFMGHMAVKNFAWSPDGSCIAYLSTEPQTEKEEGNVRVIGRLSFKTKGGSPRPLYTNGYYTHIWIVPAGGGQPEVMTPGDFNEHSITWSPDGKQIAFISNRSGQPDHNHQNDLWKVHIPTKKVTRLTQDKGGEYSPAWSPDGRFIAYLATKSIINTKDSQAEDTQLYIISEDGRDTECLTKKLDRRVENISWHPENANLIYFTAGDNGETPLYRVSIDSKKTEHIIRGKFHILEYAVSRHTNEVFCLRTDITNPAEVFRCRGTDSVGVNLSNVNASFIDDTHFQDAETIYFNSFDNLKIQGWLMKPAGFQSTGKYPLVLVIHGGPHNMFGYDFEARMQLFSGSGYGVLYINPRGSSGYGQAFSSGCVMNWGGGDYQDLMAGVDYVLQNYSWVDKDKLTVTGQSYGGYMTNWIITQTNRFKAAIVDGGLSNLISFSGTSLYHLLMESEFGGRPWENYPLLWQWSPLRNVKNVTTPTLFLHGETDNEVPITQAEEMYTALAKLDVETAFVRYVGEGHGWRPDLSPQNRHDVYKRTIDWLDKYVK